MKRYIMALDEGTTSCRTILFDEEGTIAGLGQQEFTQIYPLPGWVEHSAEEIWETQVATARMAMSEAGVTADEIAAIGITNQRETAIVWDQRTGKPIYHAIVWQCRRTAGMVEAFEPAFADYIRSVTGLVPDAYFSATKIAWLLDNVPGARQDAEAGHLLFGTVDTWLIWKLTGGQVFVTDYTNASRTMMFDIHRLCWDERILETLGIPACMLPEVRPSSYVYGQTQADLFGAPIPIAGAAGDQQAALFGQCCFEPGDVKNTYGTGCFLLMNTGTDPVQSAHGLVTTIAAGCTDAVSYALEGSVFVAGAAVQWIRDGLKLIKTSPESEPVAASVPDTQEVYVVPAFTGLGAPYWKTHVRGMITGITRGIKETHVVRATLESIAYQTYDVLRAMEQDIGKKLTCLKVDGGAAANNLLMQFQADILESEVQKPVCLETTALGAAYLAGLAVGYWPDQEILRANWKCARHFQPQMAPEEVQHKLSGWRRAVRAAIAWSEDEDV